MIPGRAVQAHSTIEKRQRCRSPLFLPIPGPPKHPRMRKDNIRPLSGPFKRRNREQIRRQDLIPEQALPLIYQLLLPLRGGLQPYRDLPLHPCLWMFLTREGPLNPRMQRCCLNIGSVSGLLILLVALWLFSAAQLPLLCPRPRDLGRTNNRFLPP